MRESATERMSAVFVCRFAQDEGVYVVGQLAAEFDTV